MNVPRTTSVVVIVLVGLLGFGAYAFAQSSGEPASSSTVTAPWDRTGGWHGGGPGWRHGWHDGDRRPDPGEVRNLRAELAGDLAEELGTSADDVEAAFRAVVAERLQAAVEADRIAEAEADDALAAYDEGDVRGLLRLRKR